MANDAIFLVSDSGELQRVEHQLYASEDILQELVAKHPEILAGDQIDPEAPPRWLLLRREAAIPDSIGGEDRWWLDHLLLDQFGKPTLVEVKRSTDTRIRREVIGQMLDYVANAQAHWAAGRMRDMLAEEAGSRESGDAKTAEFLAISEIAEQTDEINRFWQTVEANLRRGDVRLLFVADELPKELRRLIEFLNEQFTNIEVLGVELRQYVGQGIKALVPRVVGQTEAARDQKERSSPRRRTEGPVTKTNREDFFASCPPATHDVFSAILDNAEGASYEVHWGIRGFGLRLRLAEGMKGVFYGYPAGVSAPNAPTIEAYLGSFREPAAKQRFASNFLALPGFAEVTDKTIRCVLDDPSKIDIPTLMRALHNAAQELQA